MAQGQNQNLTGGRELNYVSQQNSYAGRLFQRIISAINNMAQNNAVAAVGKLPPPPQINGIQVSGTQAGNIITVPSEILHFTLTHNNAIKKGIQYVSEIATDPSFSQPHVLDHGCSRSAFLHLPTKDSNGNTQTYYLRSYAQYHGSDPAKPTVLGGVTGAIGIQMTGSSKTDLLPSTGSGTASPNGQQGGKGLGVVLNRPEPGPKRNLAL